MLITKKVSRRSSISLTPLIDVVFILLLFFMLTSTFIQMRLIDISATTESEIQQKEVSEPVIVNLLNNNGDIQIGDKKFNINNEQQAIKVLIQEKPQAVYFINSEDELAVQTVINTLDIFTTLGANSVTLAGIN